MTREETIKWLESLKAEIGKSEHRTLWHYVEAIDAAIEALSEETVSREEYEEVKAYMDTLVDAFIEDGEELAELVKVVRCKDCRYYSPIDEDKPFPCAYGLYMCNKDDFCSYGERKERSRKSKVRVKGERK